MNPYDVSVPEAAEGAIDASSILKPFTGER